MQRRDLLATLGAAGTAATAGCGMVSADSTRLESEVHEQSAGRKYLSFTKDGEEVATFGVDGFPSAEFVKLKTELWHEDGTNVKSIRLQVWMPETDGVAADVALISPVEGDSSPPPTVTLHTPDRGRGTVIEVTDLDDLKDETISTLSLLVRPLTETATAVTVDATIDLATSGLLSKTYTLDGRLELDYPKLAE